MDQDHTASESGDLTVNFEALEKIINGSTSKRWSKNLNGGIDRLGRAIEAFRGVSGTELAVDVGTSNTRIHLRGRGIISDEPSLFATDCAVVAPVAAGSRARSLIGRSPHYVSLHKPISNGAISDSESAGLMLKLFIENSWKKNLPRWFRMALTCPICATKLERRALVEAATRAGASKVFLASSVMAAAIGSGYKLDSPRAQMLILMGGGVTELGIVALGHVIYSDSSRIGGETLDLAIGDYLLRRYNLEITMELAEDIKKKIGYVEAPVPEETMRITGREAGKGGLKSLDISSTEISMAIDDPINSIVEMIQEALENSSPAVLSDLEHFPIVLSGGSSSLPGLPELISKMTGFRVTIAPNPIHGAVKGLSIIRDNPKEYSYLLSQT